MVCVLVLDVPATRGEIELRSSKRSRVRAIDADPNDNDDDDDDVFGSTVGRDLFIVNSSCMQHQYKHKMKESLTKVQEKTHLRDAISPDVGSDRS